MKHSRNFCLTLTNDITIKKLKLHEKWTKFESILTTQIRTNRIKLIDYLFNKKVLNIVSSICFCDWVKQNVKYIILQYFDQSQKKDNLFKENYTMNFKRFIIIIKNVTTMINWFMKTNLFKTIFVDDEINRIICRAM
jgi:hypothetical protein